MSEHQQADKTASPRWGWINFGILAVFLLVITVGWDVSMSALGFWLQKEPIEWPTGVTVDVTDCNNTSLTRDFGGRYRLVEGDGELFRNEDGTPKKDGEPDGIIKHSSDILESLKIGTALDTARHKDRRSNWYSSRIYEDTQELPGSPYRYWQISIDFYTGGEVTVPHVPEVCGAAGGAGVSDKREVSVECLGEKAPWNKFPVKGLTFEKNGISYVQYYLFDVNGAPELDRLAVRRILSKLTFRYIFYAKIQFSPLRGSVPNVAESDEKAAEFLTFAMPCILRELPSEQKVRKLNKK